MKPSKNPLAIILVLLVAITSPAAPAVGGHGGGHGGGRHFGGGGHFGGGHVGGHAGPHFGGHFRGHVGGHHWGGHPWGGHFWGPRVGFLFGSPWFEPWYGASPFYSYYPYYYGPYVNVVPSAPPVYVEQGSTDAAAAEQPYYWYYCTNPEGYYPYVKQCASGWKRVVPEPPPQP